MKYKVGDKVRVRSWEDMRKEFGVQCDGSIPVRKGVQYDDSIPVRKDVGFISAMKPLCGKELVISSVLSGCYKVKGQDWYWVDEMFEPINHTIVIYRKDNQVIALDKATGKTGIAYCNPEDTFDFFTGADLAYERLRGREKPSKPKAPQYYNGEIVCVKAVGPSLTEGKIYKVKNGQFTDDNGTVHGKPYPYVSLAALNLEHFSKFIEVVR